MNYPQLHAFSVVRVPQGERFLSRTCENCGPGKRLAHTSWARRPGTPKWTSRSKTIRPWAKSFYENLKEGFCSHNFCCFSFGVLKPKQRFVLPVGFQKTSGSPFSSSPRQSVFPNFFSLKLGHSSWGKGYAGIDAHKPKLMLISGCCCFLVGVGALIY